MNEKIAQYRVRAAQYWMQLSKTQKMLFGATIGILILSTIFLTMIFSKTEYELAFQNLDATDAAAIINHLESSGIPYQLGPDGTTISVPSAQASKVRVDVGSQGLVQNGSIGFDVFGQSSSAFGRTDNEFNVMYRNALNGEIQRLLNGMNGIQRTNVLVNLPEETVFMNPDQVEQASASIMMTFKPGYRPTQAEVDGYFNLVKTAIPNLAVEDITITSQEGGELFPSSKLTGNGVGASQPIDVQFQIQRKFENEIRRNIQQFLGAMYGAEGLVISVASSLNFDQKSTTEMLVRPLEDNNNNGIIISQSETNSTSTGTEGQVGGVTGTGETDVPGYQATDGQGTSSSEDMSRTTNYDVNRITNEIVSGPFVVKDLSISVGLEAAELSDDRRNEITNYLTALVRAQLADSGQNVDDDLLMGKKVSVIAQQFAGNTGDTSNTGLSLPWAIGIGVVALALIGGLAFMLIRRRKQAVIEEEELLQPAKVEYPTIDLENVTNDSQVRKQLEQLAKRKPEDFVNLLRTWLVDE
ncbi:flagellar basal-body MS-ring/collar protein FliF [Paenibacillus abyssi]|uniref:Flagellar M-ring protein n=1 Tax=Paenibacillus abyssi TaxID=1340531 RepID=A0A917FVJ7_9BACL|nr:flagellar basal-body MS-ring/collar protein FliF [Paenibacillus abyssi]GGG12420.1 flagellar M-ring protein [Paenibacillus abyssi]